MTTTKNFKNILMNRITNHDSHLLFLKHELKTTFIEPDKNRLIELTNETEIRLKECKKLLSLLS